MDKKPVPEIGKVYNCYDDGKVSYSRLYKVKILDLIKFENTGKDLFQAYLSEKDKWTHLYAKETDYFVVGLSYELSIPMIEIFVRTIDGGWFGMGFINSDLNVDDSGWCSGRLDIDNSITIKYNIDDTNRPCTFNN